MAASYPKAILTVKGKKFDVISCYYEMYRSLDSTGKPSGDVNGGLLTVTISSDTEDTTMIDQLASKTTCDGNVEFKKSDGASKLRQLDFKKAFVVLVSEQLNGNVLQMTVHITAKEIGPVEKNWPDVA